MKLYKSVNKNLSSKYDKNFKYEVGKVFELDDYDKSKEECSTGLHASDIIFSVGYEWNKDQKIIQVEVNKKDVVVEGEDKIRCSKLKVLKILTEKEIDIALEKEFYKRFKVKGLWDYCTEFRNKKFLQKKITKKEKEKITKLLIKTNKKLKPFGFDCNDKVRFVSSKEFNLLWGSLGNLLRVSLRYSLWGSLRYSLWGSLEDSLMDSLMDSLEDSLEDSLMDSLGYSLMDSFGYSLEDSLMDSLGYSLMCKLSKNYKDDLFDDLVKVYRMGYLVYGKDKNNDWVVVK